jgi:glycosyltransferase involved in cell wall biosynthesis
MNIAVNGKALGVAEKGGAVRVALSLIREIALLRPDISLDVYIPTGSGLSSPEVEPLSNVKFYLRDSSLYCNGFARSLWEQIVLPLLIRKHNKKYDLLINLTNSAPVCLSPEIPQLLLVHDVGFQNREWFSFLFSSYVTWLLHAAIARKVHLVTVSKTSASQLVNLLPKAGSVSVIPNSSDEPPWEELTNNLDYRYVLFLGSLNPRKNLNGAIAGFQAFKASTKEDIRLVVVGAEKSIFTKGTYDSLESEDISFLGYVEDRKKWSLLKGAELLLLPSFLEGFGLPILEALKVGIPVVASSIPVFQELFGDALEYVNPYSPKDIGRGIQSIVENPEKRRQMITTGKEIGNQFSWRASAQEYVRLFESIAKEVRNSEES